MIYNVNTSICKLYVFLFSLKSLPFIFFLQTRLLSRVRADWPLDKGCILLLNSLLKMRKLKWDCKDILKECYGHAIGIQTRCSPIHKLLLTKRQLITLYNCDKAVAVNSETERVIK